VCTLARILLFAGLLSNFNVVFSVEPDVAADDPPVPVFEDGFEAFLGCSVGLSQGLGEACDPCDAGIIEPFDVCGDCIDNDCDGITDPIDTCVDRQVLAIATDASGVSAGHSIALAFDHAAAVTNGWSNPSGDDLRIYHRNPETLVMQEIDRVLDPESSFNTTTSTLWFSAQEAFVANATLGDPPNTDYFLYIGVAGSPAREEGNVFHFADFFERANSSTVGGTWTETEPVGATAQIETGALAFSLPGTDIELRPVVLATFPAIDSGRWLLRMRWNWSNNGDTTFGLFTQLGSSVGGFTATPPIGTSFPTFGVGPSLVWARDVWGFASSGVGDLGTTTGVVATVVEDEFDGSSHIALRVDMNGTTFEIDPDGDLVGFSAPVTFNNSNATVLDAIRIVSHDQDGDDFTSRRFEYVLFAQLAPTGEFEPTVTFAAPPTPGPGCSAILGLQ
jgi:hypothetical protein